MAHRGPHPRDRKLFAPERWPTLQRAARELSWLLSRGYAMNASLTLVGDRHQLERRLRVALMRSVCSDDQLVRRGASRESSVSGAEVHLDGFNVVMTLEAALGGAVLLAGRDGCVRDISGVHGSYRLVDETPRAISLLGAALSAGGASECVFFLDRPVSNSGRLRALLHAHAEAGGWPWRVELEPRVDGVLRRSEAIVVTADSAILDVCGRWFDLVPRIIASEVPAARIVPVWVSDLGGPDTAA